MSAPNGRANGSATDCASDHSASTFVPLVANPSVGPQFSPEQIKELTAALEVPFDPAVIEWRVTNTTKDNAKPPRGQVIPYADQRAYTDRLNSLFTPAGWTRKYAVHTSPTFQRGKDGKTVAKVFVTCELTIFGLGSHSATGEEWTDDDNAGTSAEAQAFKRACSCFGLGRYLYHFTGTWVDLDQHKRPKTALKLFGWATPEGWQNGLRPPRGEADSSKTEARPADQKPPRQNGSSSVHATNRELVSQVEAMSEPLGRGLYRGLLKSVARAWNPAQIADESLLTKLLKHMQSAERGLRRLDAALDKTGPDPLGPILDSLKLKSLDRVEDLKTLEKIVLAMEAKVDLAPNRA